MTPSPNPDAILPLAEHIVALARRSGADIAEAVVREGTELSATVRNGAVELLTESSHRSAGVRVMRAGHVTATSTSDLSDSGIDRFVRDAIDLLDLCQEDPFAGPADPDLIAVGPFDDLDLYDPTVLPIDADHAIAAATNAERAARDFDSRITNTHAANFSRAAGATVMVLSGGFQSSRCGSSVALGVSPVANDTNGKKRRGSWYESRRHQADLPSPEAIGREAARRTVGMLGARKVPSCEAAVIFPQETARGMFATLVGCALGTSIWKKSSYLVGREGTQIAATCLDIFDNPFLPRGFGSRPHDGEGLASRANTVVEGGILRTVLCDSYCARKLARTSTASAARGGGAGVGPSTTNLVVQGRNAVPEADIIANTERGLIVTQMMGYGFNSSTGDFSRGASGYWVEKGSIAFPVSEVTISLNLDTLMKRIDLCGNQADVRSSVIAPMFRVSSMTISGS